jgi:hypothetical protein
MTDARHDRNGTIIPNVWAALEICLQFIDLPPPLWHRHNRSTFSISIPKIGGAICPSKESPISPVSLLLAELPESLQDDGGTGTLEDFLWFHSPPNAEKILGILEARKGDYLTISNVDG